MGNVACSCTHAGKHGCGQEAESVMNSDYSEGFDKMKADLVSMYLVNH